MVEYFSCENLEKTGLVKAVYTLNQSKVRWKIYSKDTENECKKYYEEFANLMNIKTSDMIRVNQKHSNNIKIVTKENAGEGVVRIEDKNEIDGIITNEKNLMLCTVEADCVPLYILDPINKTIAMIHSGWRGTVGQICIKAIDLMKKNFNAKEKNLLIHFGPSICQECYEVRKDVLEEFLKTYDKKEVLQIFKEKNELENDLEKDIDDILNNKINNIFIDKKYLLDVKKAIYISLIKKGVLEENIQISSYCTYHDDKYFDSYRKNKSKTGHILSAIMLI